MLLESYTPRTWRMQPLHICPPEPYHSENPLQRFVLDWIFVISSLNFSFWSKKEGMPDRYGVEWRSGWAMDDRKVHMGYWSLVAALNRGIPCLVPLRLFKLKTSSSRRWYPNNQSNVLLITSSLSWELDGSCLSTIRQIKRRDAALTWAHSYHARKWLHLVQRMFFNGPL